MSEAISTSKEIVVDPYSIPLDGNFNVAQSHLFEQCPPRNVHPLTRIQK